MPFHPIPTQGGKLLYEITQRDWIIVVTCSTCGRVEKITARDMIFRVSGALGATLDAFSERLACQACPDGGQGRVGLQQGHSLRDSALDHAPLDERIARLVGEARGRRNSTESERPESDQVGTPISDTRKCLK